MLWIVLLFLAASIYLYCLLGGADFGVGIHELLVKRDQKRQHEEIVKEAMGPVWEANHMWLIIVVVILFVGFPKIYSEVSIYLHIPLTLMLIGIIMRGCAFSFRHYDAIEDGSRKYYSLVFYISSLLTPITFGIIIGSLMLGKIQPVPGNYFSTYIAPWLNLFSFSTGLFILSIFTFIASVYMIGEAFIGPFKKNYISRSKVFHIVMIVMGALVFITAQIEGHPLFSKFISNPVSLLAISLVTISHVLLWRLFETKRAWSLRVLTGFQLLMIIVAWMAVIYPKAILYADGSSLSFLAEAAPEATLLMLGCALIVGAMIFLPLLGYLFFTFKRFHV